MAQDTPKQRMLDKIVELRRALDNERIHHAAELKRVKEELAEFDEVETALRARP